MLPKRSRVLPSFVVSAAIAALCIGCGGSSGGGSAEVGAGGSPAGADGGGAFPGAGGSSSAGAKDGGTGDAVSGDGDATNYILGPVTDNQAPITIGFEHHVAYEPFLVLSDAKGDIFVMDITGVNKFGPNLDPIWHSDAATFPTLLATNVEVDAFNVSSEGNVTFGGDSFYSKVRRSEDVTVGKLNTDGTLAWSKNVGLTDGVADIHATMMLSGGDVIAGGHTPAPWLARIKADGSTTTWLKQYPPFLAEVGTSAGALFEDASGNIEFVTANQTLKVDSTGTELLRSELPPHIAGTFTSFLPMAMTPRRDGFYSWSSFSSSGPGIPSYTALGFFNLDLVPQWARPAQPTRYAEYPDGTHWEGSFKDTTSVMALAVTADAVYLMGDYGNVKEPVRSDPFYVGRYDLEGNRVWFQEYLPEKSTSVVYPGRQLFVIPDGNLTVFVGSDKGFYAFKLNSADGSLL
jgi:hypothetical protein